ncbi:ribbon-helix-helix protein, CopG family [Stenotrophomonas maltophilia]|nr:ribbon-helix-helix protein, CopG family [Stenotrophomonas maltophilia]MBA0276067.1 ribbon-helix-helix protein, CopG family [Stenotrophomonas maltophilia]MBA0411266.1 ribbon-helix-helix protein, CopG family [Stenotrophomonas maltophilia]MBA0496369.1 ribbon-helix-helix protein, CopG family [Stenotrophomonas maltophilia]MBA0505803.1 ribbon-helix-helix protein, CopG family [Stenotrophomonas maltophilia]
MQMAVRVPRELKERLEQAAAREGMHVSELVRWLLNDALKRREAPEPKASQRPL